MHCLYFFIITILISIGKCDDLLIANTSYGYVYGAKIITNNNEKYAFLGIPYGLVMKNRFKASEPPKKWREIKNLTYYDDSCFVKSYKSTKNSTKMSEECLRLNIITTEYCLMHGKCPVLVIISGGEFNFMNRNIYNGNKTIGDLFYQDKKNIVLVEGNYRKGIIGNLNLNSNYYNLSMHRNVGLHDIHDILKWVHNEISSFGGNSRDVTLMGLGDGAICGSILLYSEKDKNFFHKLILIPLSYDYIWNKKNNNENISREIAISVGCANTTTNWNSYDNIEYTIKCLRSVDIVKLMKSEKKLENEGYDKALPFIDFGNNSFFQYSLNETVMKKINIPILMIGYLIKNETSDDSIFCKFYINYITFNNNSLINSLNLSIPAPIYNTIWRDENIGLFLTGKNECLKNFNFTRGSFIYHSNFLTLNPNLYNILSLKNESTFFIESIFSIEKNSNTRTDPIVDVTFQKSLINFIKTGSLELKDEESVEDDIITYPENDNISLEVKFNGEIIYQQTLVKEDDGTFKKYLYKNLIENDEDEMIIHEEVGKKLIGITIFLPQNSYLNETNDLLLKNNFNTNINFNISLLIIIFYCTIIIYIIM